jgi:hypothetical protein
MNSVRLAVGVGVALVAATVWMGWQVHRVSSELPPQADQAAPPAEDAPRPLPRLAPPLSLSAPRDPNTIEVCGLGLVEGSSPEKAREAALQYLAPPAWEALRSLAATWSGSGDAMLRALARRLAWRLSVELQGGAPGCNDDPNACAPAAGRDHRARDALAREAATSTDPQLYALALQTCHDGTAPPSAACGQLSVAQWARLEPDNAVPWLWMAAGAADQGDELSQADALFHAANARYSDQRFGLAFRLLSQPELQSLEPPVRTGATQLLLESATGRMPDYATALQYCAPGMDSNRVQVCERLAAVLVDQGRTLLDLTIGGSLGQRVGWPLERLEALTAERSSLMALDPAAAPQDLSCEAQQARVALALQIGRQGEIAALRSRRDPPPAPQGR